MKTPHPALTSLIITGILAGCGVPELMKDPRQLTHLSMPNPASSKYFEVVSAGFLLNVKEKPVGARYTLELLVKEPQSAPLYLTVEYENPRNKHQPSVQKLEIPLAVQEIPLQSDLLEGFRGGWDYWVTIKTHSDPERTREVDRLMQKIRSSVTTDSLK